MNKFCVSLEGDPKIHGVLIKNQTMVLNPDSQKDLEQKGYGEFEKNKFYLKSFESLYLLYTGTLTLLKGKKKVDFDSLMQICKKNDESILT